MQKKRMFTLFVVAFMFGCLVPTTTVFAQGKTPIAPSVFLGDHRQAAIILDYVWTADSYGDSVCPSVITDIWYDGEAGLYFVASPEPLRLYHWVMGKEEIRLVAVQDDMTDIHSLALKKKNTLHEPSEDLLQHIAIQEGVLVDIETDRPLPTPPFETVDVVFALPDGMIAVVSFAEGISIVNTTLQTSHPLVVDPHWAANTRLLRCFALANADIPLKQTVSRNRIGGSPVFGTIIPLHDMLRCMPGMVDVFCAPIEEAEAARRKGRLMDLSVSVPLLDKVSYFHQRIQEVLLREGFLTGIPIDVSPRLWSIMETDKMLWGEVAIPKSFDELITLVYGKPYENGLIYTHPDAIPVEEIFYAWMTSQYIAQYAQESEPLNFDTQTFRKLLMEAARAYASTFNIQNDEAYRITLNYDIGLPWALGIQGFLPPTFVSGEEPQVYTEMNVWCVDASTPHAEQALRFLMFQSRYTDPIYEMLLIPNSYRVIRWQPEAAKLSALVRLLAQARQRNQSDEVRMLYREMDALIRERAFIEPETYSFYAREMAPRLKFLFGGMYEDLDATDMGPDGNYAPETDAFCAVVGEYICGETSDINGVIQELNRLAHYAYDLWHEDGYDSTFFNWLEKRSSQQEGY